MVCFLGKQRRNRWCAELPLCARERVKYAFMKAELVAWFPIAVICRVLAVTQAGYHAWLKRPASPSAIERDALAELVKGVFYRV